MPNHFDILDSMDPEAREAWAELHRRQDAERRELDRVCVEQRLAEEQHFRVMTEQRILHEEQRTQHLEAEAARQVELAQANQPALENTPSRFLPPELDPAQRQPAPAMIVEPDYSRPVPEDKVREVEAERLKRDLDRADQAAREAVAERQAKADAEFGDDPERAEEKAAWIEARQKAAEAALEAERRQIEIEAAERLQRMLAPYGHDRDR